MAQRHGIWSFGIDVSNGVSRLALYAFSETAKQRKDA